MFRAFLTKIPLQSPPTGLGGLVAFSCAPFPWSEAAGSSGEDDMVILGRQAQLHQGSYHMPRFVDSLMEVIVCSWSLEGSIAFKEKLDYGSRVASHHSFSLLKSHPVYHFRFTQFHDSLVFQIQASNLCRGTFAPVSRWSGTLGSVVWQ